eukprot:4141720-Pleurochrysis_carterae.AAC.1
MRMLGRMPGFAHRKRPAYSGVHALARMAGYSLMHPLAAFAPTRPRPSSTAHPRKSVRSHNDSVVVDRCGGCGDCTGCQRSYGRGGASSAVAFQTALATARSRRGPAGTRSSWLRSHVTVVATAAAAATTAAATAVATKAELSSAGSRPLWIKMVADVMMLGCTRLSFYVFPLASNYSTLWLESDL